VYIPLPNALHAKWTIQAIRAGKHVLCEKPFACNEKEALLVKEAADESTAVVMEALHYRYHPLAERVRELIENGRIGAVRHIVANMSVPIPFASNIRYDLSLGGGATMDVGAYTINMIRYFGGQEPEVVEATAKLKKPGVDRSMYARFRYPGGATAEMTCSLWSVKLLKVSLKIIGEKGIISVINPVAPQFFHRLRIDTENGSSRETLSKRSTYEYQLEAFVNAIIDNKKIRTPPLESVANMKIIDQVYLKAGLEPRPALILGEFGALTD
jgi:predicted dehydrogenase